MKEKLNDKQVEKKKQLQNEFAGLEDDEMGNPGGDGQQEIIDEEELGYLQKMKELKKTYREKYDQLATLKNDAA